MQKYRKTVIIISLVSINSYKQLVSIFIEFWPSDVYFFVQKILTILQSYQCKNIIICDIYIDKFDTYIKIILNLSVYVSYIK